MSGRLFSWTITASNPPPRVSLPVRRQGFDRLNLLGPADRLHVLCDNFVSGLRGNGRYKQPHATAASRELRMIFPLQSTWIHPGDGVEGHGLLFPTQRTIRADFMISGIMRAVACCVKIAPVPTFDDA